MLKDFVYGRVSEKFMEVFSMKKGILKRIGAALLTAVMCMGLVCTSAWAADDGEAVYDVLTESVARGAYPPSITNFWNLGANKYTATFDDLAAKRGVYTEYFFATTTGKITLDFTLDYSGTTQSKTRTLIFELYEMETIISEGVLKHTMAASFTGEGYKDKYTFRECDPNKFYYFKFYNESGKDPASRMDISAVIVIDER